MKKRLPSLLLAGAMVWSLTSCAAGDPPEPLVGTGEGLGYGGSIQVEVTVSPDKSVIQQIQVIKSGETQGIGSRAIQVLSQSILEEQTLSLDTISGATLASQGFLGAVRGALTTVGVPADSFSTPASLPFAEQTLNTDVVIVGAGGAGMTAAIAAARTGKQVVILEKNAISGGNSARSTSGVNAAGTQWQDDNGWAGDAGLRHTLRTATESYPQLRSLASSVEKEYSLWNTFSSKGCFDTPNLFLLDTLVAGGGENDPDLAATMAENSANAISWLDNIGAPLHSVGFFPGSSVNRLHRPVDSKGKILPTGPYLIPLLEQACIDNGVEIFFNAPVFQILMEEGKAVGVRANGYTVNAKSVILATGGFAADLTLTAELRPELAGCGTTNIPGATGDGIKMAQVVGADTVDLDRIQSHPTVEQKTSTPISLELLSQGAILVNQEGRRFCDETLPQEALSSAELEQSGGYAYLLFDQRMADSFDPITEYIQKGFAVQGDTYAELARTLNIPENTFADTMTEWNTAAVSHRDSAFGRTSFAGALDTPPFYAIQVAPGVHHTIGGLKINSSAEVQSVEGNSIPGLFAAGEVTGGIHGETYLEGNATTDFLVFGRIAGENAAANAE